MIGGSNDDCGMIQWSHTFSFYDLWNKCNDTNGEPSFSLIETNDKISLRLNFNLTIVSPNPICLQQCKNGAKDCDQYLVKTLLSHSLSITFTKSLNIISNKDDVMIYLHQMLCW